ncbi:uncharacterized protein LOC143548583 [Bidens hawaiensis]|uniref:uncharacterized protein LOC143548583 n=1 Tax=Bidens hawaiensis TaxID=980011 RepID=UPI0040498768
MVRDTFKENPQTDLKLRIVGTRKYDGRTYNLLTASEFVALIFGDFGDAMDKRDIIVNSRSGGLRQISEFHPSYSPLQFPLLFPFGEDGYKVDIPHRNVVPSSTAARKKYTMREFFAYRLQDRPNQFSLPLNGQRLFQQLLVDEYTMVESQRLHFIRRKQSELRSDTYESLRNLKTTGNSDASTSGQRVILPSSFTGGSRYMMQNYLDAMCLCRWYGYPDFFLTITCNPGWPEVKRFLKDTNLNSKDRPDILCRIFKMKLDSMIKLMKDKALFGKIKAAVYTIEFQKRGLPHAHIFLFIAPENKIQNPSHIDNFISSEIPDKVTEPDLYQLVSDHMLHGPCGEANPSCCPAVTRLPFHLPGQQQIIYGPEEDIDDVLTKTSNSVSMFTDWMEANRNYEHARRLSYAEFPTQDACYRRGLLDDDKEYIETIEEASHTANGYYLRNLFATMLITSSLSRPDYVWDNTWQFLVDGILYHQQKKRKNPGRFFFQIEDFLVSNNSSLRRFSHMPFPDQESVSTSMNPLMMEELSYDKDSLSNDFKLLYTSLTDEQKSVYNEIFNSVKRKKGGVFFVYGYSGTGITYLWKTLSASIRSKGEIVLNVASSGIASLLLEGGRTAHSRFLIPINLTEDSQCQVKGNTDVSELLKKTSLIIWDEAPMIHKHAFEALDRTLKDVMNIDLGNTSGSLFGCKVVILGGDFRQILLVVQNGTRNDCVNATISSSYIWSNCKVLKLTKNMRLTVGSQMSNTLEIKQFADWLLDIGQGNLGGPNDGEATIIIPRDLLIKDSLDPMSDLIDFVYPSMLDRFNDLTYFQERALLAPLNDFVQEINDRILEYFPGQEMEYLSSIASTRLKVYLRILIPRCTLLIFLMV